MYHLPSSQRRHHTRPPRGEAAVTLRIKTFPFQHRFCMLKRARKPHTVKIIVLRARMSGHRSVPLSPFLVVVLYCANNQSPHVVSVQDPLAGPHPRYTRLSKRRCTRRHAIDLQAKLPNFSLGLLAGCKQLRTAGGTICGRANAPRWPSCSEI